MNQVWKGNAQGGRPITPKFAVVHAAGEKIGGVDAFEFFDKNGIGAHALFYPDGTIVRMRDTRRSIGQALNHNSTSIGAEFLVPGDHNWDSFVKAMKVPAKENNIFTDAQYEAGGAWYAMVCKEHNITPDQIISHEWVDRLEIPGKSARKEKEDPGVNFRWDKFYAAFYKHY
ncbi:MAG TPA: hypothetical protein DCR93_00225 [Cytophagales bacterium]|nr:hypothetical protein [Cytophagales bacterium]HAP57991.1 hypothetical protein [Cytophagales bacterium]